MQTPNPDPEGDSYVCFDAFVDEVTDTIHSYFEDRAVEKAEEFHTRMTKLTHAYLAEIIRDRDRLAPRTRCIDVTCPEENDTCTRN